MDRWTGQQIACILVSRLHPDCARRDVGIKGREYLKGLPGAEFQGSAGVPGGPCALSVAHFEKLIVALTSEEEYTKFFVDRRLIECMVDQIFNRNLHRSNPKARPQLPRPREPRPPAPCDSPPESPRVGYACAVVNPGAEFFFNSTKKKTSSIIDVPFATTLRPGDFAPVPRPYA